MPSDERVTITMRSDMSGAFRQTVAGGRCVLIDELGRKALRFQDVLRNSIRTGLASDPAIPSDQVLAELPTAPPDFSSDARVDLVCWPLTE